MSAARAQAVRLAVCLSACALGLSSVAVALAWARARPVVVARWIERVHRLPRPVWGLPSHAPMALGGGALGTLTVHGRILKAVALPTKSPIVAIVPWKGGLAIASFDDGAWALKNGRARPLRLGFTVNALAVGPDGALYAATNQGAFRVSAEGQVEQLGPGAYVAVTVWRGRPWFAAPHGIATVDDRGFILYGREHGVSAAHPSTLAGCGQVLCIGAEDGLWLFDGTSARHVSAGSGALPSDEVTAVVFAHPRTIWAGTFDAGLARIGADAHRRMAPSDGLPEGRIDPRALVRWRGATVAGTPTGLLVVRDGRAGELTHLPSSEITALGVADQALWIGYRGGIARLALEAR